jgi:glutaredoxin
MTNKLCVKCKKFYASEETHFLCSYCFSGYQETSKEEKKQFVKNLKQNILVQMKEMKIKTVDDNEFQDLLKILKNLSIQELYATLLGERQIPRTFLSGNQTNLLLENLPEDFKSDGCLSTIAMFCYEFEHHANIRRVNPEEIDTKDALIIFLKRWKFKKFRLERIISHESEFIISVCISCSLEVTLGQDFDDCVECHQLICGECCKSAKLFSWVFDTIRSSLKLCRYCANDKKKLSGKLIDVHFCFY